jgi:hypothetical protein
VQPARDRFGLGAHPCGLAAAAADEGEARPRRRRWCQAASTSSGRAWPLLVLLIGPGGAVSSAATSTIVTCAGTRDLRNRSAPPHRRPEPAPAASATNQTAVPRRGTGTVRSSPLSPSSTPATVERECRLTPPQLRH